MLGLAVAADRVRVRAHRDGPGVAGDVPVPRRARGLVLARGTDPLGHLRVGVQAVQLVAVGGERVEHGRVVEALRHGEPALVVGHEVEVGEHRVHAAELDPQGDLHLRLRQPAGASVHPAREPQQDVARLRAAQQPPDVQQAGERLVDRVVRDVAGPGLDGVEVGLREAGQVPRREPGGAVVGLALGQLRHHRRGLVAARRVAQHRPRLRPGREEVALAVGAEREVRSLPAAERLGALRRQPVVGAEVVQQAVDVDAAQVGERAVLVLRPAAAAQPHLAELEGPGTGADLGTGLGQLGGVRPGDRPQLRAGCGGEASHARQLQEPAAGERRARAGGLGSSGLLVHAEPLRRGDVSAHNWYRSDARRSAAVRTRAATNPKRFACSRRGAPTTRRGRGTQVRGVGQSPNGPTRTTERGRDARSGGQVLHVLHGDGADQVERLVDAQQRRRAPARTCRAGSCASRSPPCRAPARRPAAPSTARARPA